VFEVWNEPDLGGFWGPAPDLAEYATMFAQARAAIKASQPAATVIIGGLVHPAQSLPAMIAANPALPGNVDGVAIHAYRLTAATTLQTVTGDLRADTATLDVPLYVNEYGWQTANTFQNAGEADRDTMIDQVTAQLGQIPQVADIELYCWSGPTAFAVYGTPAVAAFAAGIAAGESLTAAPSASTPTPPQGQPAILAPVLSHSPAPTARQTSLMVRGRAALVGVRCTGEPAAICRLTLVLAAADVVKHRGVRRSSMTRPSITGRIIAGRSTATLATGRSDIITVALNRTGGRLLARDHNLKVKLAIIDTLDRKPDVLTTDAITFRADRRPRVPRVDGRAISSRRISATRPDS
jgi:hypothetical protein